MCRLKADVLVFHNRIVPLPPTLIPQGEDGRNLRRMTGQKLHIHCLSLTTFQPHPWAVNARIAAERGERLSEDDGTTTLEDVFGQVSALGSLVIQVGDLGFGLVTFELILDFGTRFATKKSSCTQAGLMTTHSAMLE
jgi:hypothetical protein